MNKIVIRSNKSCQILTDDQDLLRVLISTMSYKMTGVEFTEAYKNGWNGYTYLVSKKGMFYFGLLDKVKEFLNDRNVSFEVVDERQPLQINEPIDISTSLKRIKKIPRDYQQNITDVATARQNGIIRACTGSGKTLCIATITAKLNKPTIVYVIGLDLLKQCYDLFTEIFDEPIGYIGDGICKIERINIASIWTIGRALNVDKKKIISDDEISSDEKFNKNQTKDIVSLLSNTKVHIFDECHVVTCDTIQSIHKKIDPEHIYGFSGTPFRDDNTDLLINGILGEQIINVSASDLIDKGILAQPIIKFYTIPKMSLPMAPYQTVYKSYITDNIVRNTIAVKCTKDLLDKGYTPLILFKNINHGKILYDMMLDADIKCEMLYGNDSLARRTEVKEALEKGHIQAILASTIFDLGVDIPLLNSLVLCGGGKSSIRALQRIGRVIRYFPGKKFAAVVDFYDQVKFLKKHSKIREQIYSSEKGFRIIKSKEMAKG